MVRRWVTACEEETRRLGATLAAELRPAGLLLLYGEMGSGKTVLAVGVGEALGVERREIQSPTFTLVHEHLGHDTEFLHIDLFRLSPEEAMEVGLEELLARHAVIVVEWAERLPFVPPGGLRLRISRDGERRILEEMR